MTAAMPYRTRLVVSQVVVDTLGTVAALCACALVSGQLDAWEVGKQSFYWLLVLMVPTQLLVFHLAGAYACLRGSVLGDWLRTALAGMAVTLGLFAIFAFTLQISDLFSRAMIIGWIGLTVVGIVSSRLIAHALIQRRLVAGLSGERTLLVGASAACEGMAKHLLSHPNLGYRPVATLPMAADGSGADGLEGVLDSLHATQVMVCARLDCHDLVQVLLRRLGRTAVEVHFAPDLDGVMAFCQKAGDLAGRPVFHLATSPFTPGAIAAKWTMDMVGAGILLVMAAPVMLIIAAAVLTSPGPVLFKQRRHGLGGRVITVWKFRTMYAAVAKPASVAYLEPAFVGMSATAHRISERLLARTVSRPSKSGRMRTTGDASPQDFVQAVSDDPRITPVGRLLRKTSLDELPQLFNVLSGEMSLVGPRPHALRHNHQFAVELDEMMRRHYVKPGITGLAQVGGARGETRTVDDMRRRVELDLEYIRTWSPWLDVKILVRTVFVGFFNRQP